jgi:glycosyltransferase involved in cell wall biosynthesis
VSHHVERVPFVSLIIPMRNEEKYIAQCLDSLLHQDYDPDRYEILVVDAKSTDNSRRIVEEKAHQSGRVRLLTNQRRTTPHGFNVGIRESNGDLCIIFSAHAYAPPDFISKSAHCIQTTGADCVGGQVDIDSENTLARAVALAMSSPFGMGNVHFRSSSQPGFVDTVTFCTYRKEIFDP